MKLVIKRSTQVVFKKPFLLFFTLCALLTKKKKGEESNLNLLMMHLLQYVGGIILLRVESNPISGQLLPFHLVQNDLTEWATIL